MASEMISLKVPDIDGMSDDELANFLRMRDGRWSQQTKSLLARFGTNKLNLNRGWAGLWQGWSCPCCERSKPQIARLNSSGVLLCQVELHHDHVGDWAEREFTERNPRTDDGQTNRQIDCFKDAMLELVLRFGRTPLCIDCNLVEGRVKKDLGPSVPRDFSFSPAEIAQFIFVRDNKIHEFDLGKAKEIWGAVKADVEDRMDFARRMTLRFANGKNRRQHGGQPSPEFYIDSSAILWRVLSDNTNVVRLSGVAQKAVARSTARDAVGRSANPKPRAPGKPPTDEEYEAIGLQNTDQKHWGRFGDDWTCDCCSRSKRAICRKSNSGKWTARIHVIRDWELDAPISDLMQSDEVENFYVFDHVPAFVCQDCRNVVAEMQRRDDELGEYSVTLPDVRSAIVAITPNAMHDVDFDHLIERAHENSGLEEAIGRYHKLEANSRYYLDSAKRLAKWKRWSPEQARNELVKEHMEIMGCTLEEAADFIDWYLAKGKKFEALRELELGPKSTRASP